MCPFKVPKHKQLNIVKLRVGEVNCRILQQLIDVMETLNITKENNKF